MASSHVRKLQYPCLGQITPTRATILKNVMRGVLPYSLKDWPIRQPPPPPEFLQLGASSVSYKPAVLETLNVSPSISVDAVDSAPGRLLPPVGPEDSDSAHDVFARVVARLFS